MGLLNWWIRWVDRHDILDQPIRIWAVSLGIKMQDKGQRDLHIVLLVYRAYDLNTSINWQIALGNRGNLSLNNVIESNGYDFSSESITCINLCEFCLWFCFPILIISLSYPHHILIISSCSIPSRPWTSSANAMVFMASAWRWKSWCPRRTGFSRGARPGEAPFLKWQFSEVVLAGCERFDMFHERCKHDQTWLFPWYFLMSLNFAGDSSLPSLMLRHVCSSFFLTIILLHYTWGMVSQGKKSFGEGESRLCDNFCGSNSNEFSYMAPWIWWFGTMYRLNIIAFIIYEYQTSNLIYNL